MSSCSYPGNSLHQLPVVKPWFPMSHTFMAYSLIYKSIFSSGFLKGDSSVQLLSCVWLFATPWTAAHQASLSYHQLPKLAQTHVHWVGDAIQPSHPLLSSSPPAFSLSQHQGLFQWDSSSHQVAKVLEFQLQHQSFQWIFRTDFL